MKETNEIIDLSVPIQGRIPAVFLPQSAASTVELPHLSKKEDERRKGGAVPIPAGAGSAGLSFGSTGVPSVVTLGSGAGPRALLAGRLWGNAPRILGINSAHMADFPFVAAVIGILATGVLLAGLFGLLTATTNKTSDPLFFTGGSSAAENRPSGENYVLAPEHSLDLVRVSGRQKDDSLDGIEENPEEESGGSVPGNAPAGHGLDIKKTVEKIKGKVKKPRLVAAKIGDFHGGGKMNGNFGKGQLRDALANMRRPATMRPKAQFTNKIKGFRREKRAAHRRGPSVRRARSSRAMGQLKFAANRSLGAARTGKDNGKRRFAADAFEQEQTQGGELGLSVPGGGAVVPPGTGAPDITSAANPPPAGQSGNRTPYQGNVDSGLSKAAMAVSLLVLGGLMIVIGIAMVLIGKHLVTIAPTLLLGAKQVASMGMMLIGLGKKIAAAGAALVAMGLLMAMLAKGEGKKIADQHGQKDQGAVVEDCGDQAFDKQNCRARRTRIPRSTIQEDVARERNANYELENGGPIN